jgi:rhamnosyltransferase subunit B
LDFNGWSLPRRAAGDNNFPGGVRRCLDAGGPPVAVTFGSGMRQGAAWFAAAANALGRLGRRGLLLTPFREQVPGRLPPGVTHFD